MSAESIVEEALADVPSSLAAGIVDMASGTMLAMKTVEGHSQAAIDLLAPATKDLFEGDMVHYSERSFGRARGVVSDPRCFREILIASEHLWHYFGRLKADPEIVLSVVSRGDVNMAQFLLNARRLRDGGTV